MLKRILVAGAALIAGSCAGLGGAAQAAPFSMNGSSIGAYAYPSYFQVVNMPLGYNGQIGVTSGPAGSYPHAILTASGVTVYIDDLFTTYGAGPMGTTAEYRCYFLFTPTVPNLSYSFNGFMNVVQLGNPASMIANSTVYLKENVANGAKLYENAVSYSGPCALWTPTTPQIGSQSGDLVMGQPYEMVCIMLIGLNDGNDPAADFRVKLKGNPYFQLFLHQRPCSGDLNGDGFVDDSDFAIFAMAYEILDCDDPTMPPGCPSDLNHDGIVDDSDFVIFVAAYDDLLCP